MPLIIVGKVAVAAAGTPVQLTASAVYQAALTARGFSGTVFKSAQAVYLEAWKANTDEVYVGRSDMVRSTGAGVMSVLGVPSAGNNPSVGAANAAVLAGVDLDAIYFDADVSGEGPLVSILVS